MTAAKATDTNELRMSSKEFDRIMSQALRVKPDEPRNQKRPTKTKASRKKRDARK
jgi:hypothetical protein